MDKPPAPEITQEAAEERMEERLIYIDDNPENDNRLSPWAVSDYFSNISGLSHHPQGIKTLGDKPIICF